MNHVFAAQWEALFARPWPVWGAAILVAVTNVFLFAFDRPFTASDGVRAVMLGWAALATWNEASGKFSALG